MIFTKHLEPGKIYQYSSGGLYFYHPNGNEDTNEFAFSEGDIFTVLAIEFKIIDETNLVKTTFTMNGLKYMTYFRENTEEYLRFVELTEWPKTNMIISGPAIYPQ